MRKIKRIAWIVLRILFYLSAMSGGLLCAFLDKSNFWRLVGTLNFAAYSFSLASLIDMLIKSKRVTGDYPKPSNHEPEDNNA